MLAQLMCEEIDHSFHDLGKGKKEVFRMANLSLREAVNLFDVSRPTLSKALKSGKVSGVQDGKGKWSIDPAELYRVYQYRKADPANEQGNKPDNFPTLSRPLTDNVNVEIAALKADLEAETIRRVAAEAMADERARHIDDLRRMLPAPGASKPRGWWPWSR